MARAKCPACGSTTLTIIESGAIHSHFQQTDGVIDPVGYHSDGLITGIRCECACGHRWTPRGVAQVTGLEGHPDYRRLAPPSSEHGGGDARCQGCQGSGYLPAGMLNEERCRACGGTGQAPGSTRHG